MLGKLQPKYFPKIFGPRGNQPLDLDVVKKKFASLTESIGRQTGDNRTPHGVAEGFLKIAVDNMAHAIKKISLQKGHDVTEYTLCCFGGAGGQHACLVAEALGMETIFIHSYASVLSAYGMGLADVRSIQEKTVESLLVDSLLEQLDQSFIHLQKKAVTEVCEQRVPLENVKVKKKLYLRYEGTDSALILEMDHFLEMDDSLEMDGSLKVDKLSGMGHFKKNSPEILKIRQQFENRHQKQFGFIMPQKSLVVESLFVEAVGSAEVYEEEASTDQICEDKTKEKIPEKIPKDPISEDKISKETMSEKTMPEEIKNSLEKEPSKITEKIQKPQQTVSIYMSGEFVSRRSLSARRIETGRWR